MGRLRKLASKGAEEIDPRQDKAWRRLKNLSCSYCPPHAGENATRTYGKHGPRPGKGKHQKRGSHA